LDEKFARTQHFLGLSLIRFEDFRHASAETYSQNYHVVRNVEGDDFDYIHGRRYLDKMEKRGDEWRIYDRERGEETETVVSLHVGSSGFNPTASDAPAGLSVALFPVTSMQAAVDWVWSGVCIRFPGLKVVVAEGGIGWVPVLMDRLDYVVNDSDGDSTWPNSQAHFVSVWSKLSDEDIRKITYENAARVFRHPLPA
jgi:hypothetical protein